MSLLPRFTTIASLILRYRKLNRSNCKKLTQIFAKLAIESYKKIGHYFGHYIVGRTPLGGRKYEKRHGVSFLGIESRNDVFLQKTEMRRGRVTLPQKAMYM